jgi:hypothetical protein
VKVMRKMESATVINKKIGKRHQHRMTGDEK